MNSIKILYLKKYWYMYMKSKEFNTLEKDI